MYNHNDPLDRPPRPNRISFYLFNAQGGLGIGSYVQVPIRKKNWIHVVGVADSSRTYLYKDGQYIRCDTYRGPAQAPCAIHFQAPPNQNLQLVIDPEAGAAPLRLGTKDLGSFFEGGLTLYSADTTPQNGLVAEFLLNRDTGGRAVDTAQGNTGVIFNPKWVNQS
jgi:hypothetical protein